MNRAWAAAVASLCGGLFVACSSPPTASSPPSTTGPSSTAGSSSSNGGGSSVSSAAVRQAFLSDETTVRNAQSRGSDAINALGADPAASQVASAVAPLIMAVQTYRSQLKNLPWPASMATDAHALIGAIGGVLGVLQTVGQQHPFSTTAWEAQLAAAGKKAMAATNQLRQDLGLPPLSS